jgi:hypothetical protein
MTEPNNYVLTAMDVGHTFADNYGYMGITLTNHKRPDPNLKGRLNMCL